MTSRAASLLGIMGVLLLSACQEAHVQVAFDHQSASGKALRAAPLGAGSTPTTFGIKLVAIYLVEDVDAASMDNVGQVARIWTNPVCDEELRECSIGPSGGEHQVKDYFDLALPSAEVNANLNSQGAALTPGTYRYLKVELAGILRDGDEDAVNMVFGGAGGVPHEVRFRDNSYTVPLDPPLELADGDSATVTLGYDMAGSFFDEEGLDESSPPEGDFQSWYCGDHTLNPAGGPCLRFFGFTPAIAKVAP